MQRNSFSGHFGLIIVVSTLFAHCQHTVSTLFAHTLNFSSLVSDNNFTAVSETCGTLNTSCVLIFAFIYLFIFLLEKQAQGQSTRLFL